MFQLFDPTRDALAWWQGISSAVALGGCTAAIRYAWKTIETARLRRHYRLHGTYISYYEDQDSGRKFTQKAEIQMKQSGLKISGSTKDVNTDRKWMLAGQIIPPTSLSGTYYQTDPSDPSAGVFFLQSDAKGKGVWRGLWAGFDSQNHMVTAGEYVWRRCPDIRISRLGRRDHRMLAKVCGLLGRTLGARYITKETLDAYISQRKAKRLLVAVSKGDLLGVQLVDILANGSIQPFETRCGFKIEDHSLGPTSVGLLKSLAVREDSRGAGVGSKLTGEALKWLERSGCNVVFAVVWNSGDKGASLGMLQAQGFEKVKDIANFWTEESVREEYECPKCGAPPCRCAAILMRKRF